MVLIRALLNFFFTSAVRYSELHESRDICPKEETYEDFGNDIEDIVETIAQTFVLEVVDDAVARPYYNENGQKDALNAV